MTTTFTKADFMGLLMGEPSYKTMDRFHMALSARLTDVENVTGKEATRIDLQRAVQRKESKCFFYVPSFFYSALESITQCPAGELSFFRMKLKPWDKEHIRAELDMEEIARVLKEDGVPDAGRELY